MVNVVMMFVMSSSNLVFRLALDFGLGQTEQTVKRTELSRLASIYNRGGLKKVKASIKLN
jgi:hypothetical protein